MNFIPSPLIVTALLSSLALPIFLIILSHKPCQIRGLGQRFVWAALLAVGLWVGLSMAEGAKQLWNLSELIPDLVAGLLILATAILCSFTFWTLIAWGFTLSMLMSLARAKKPLTLEEWVAAYTDGQDLKRFTLDRLGLLFRFGWATQNGDRIAIVLDRGASMARWTRRLRFVFGLER